MLQSNELRTGVMNFARLFRIARESSCRWVGNRIEQKSEHLSGQEKGLSISCAGADSVIEFTQHCMEHSTDDEIMCMSAELQRRIDQEINEHQKTSLGGC